MKKIFIMLMMLAPMAAFAQKFGHVDAQAIMQSMPDYIKAQGELDSQAKILENEEKELITEFQRQVDEYQKNMNTMNPTAREEKEKQLTEMQQKVEQKRQDDYNAIQKLQQDKLQPLQQKLLKAIENVGKAGNYVYIMQLGSALYISSTLSEDVTAKVKAELNK